MAPIPPLIRHTTERGDGQGDSLVSYVSRCPNALLYSITSVPLLHNASSYPLARFQGPIRPLAQSHEATLPLRRSVFYGKATTSSSVSRALRACVPLPAPTGKGRLPCRNRFLSVQWRYQFSRWIMARATRYNMQKTLVFSVIE